MRNMMNLRRGIYSSFVPGGAAKSRWRLWTLTTNDPPTTNYSTIAEINFRETLGADGLMNGIATANVAFDATYNAPKAFDGLTSTAWITPARPGGVAGCWCEMLFSAPREIVELRLQAFNSAAGANQMIRTFRIEYFDGSAWVERYNNTAAPATGWAANESRVFTF